MKKRIAVAVIFVPLLFVILFFLPPIALTITVALIAGISSFELLRSVNAAQNVGIYVYAAAAAALIQFGVWLGIGVVVFRTVMFLLTALLFLEAILAYHSERRITLAQIAVVLFAGAVIPYFLSTLINLRILENGKYYALLPFVAAFVSDGGAYFAGVFLGKHKMAPYVSPKKTVEGCVGGLVSAVIAMVVYGLILQTAGLHVNILIMTLYGLLGSVVTQLGDLAFSLIKREYGVKDYGNLLPGHGGMLDRFDSMVFAAPAVYMLVLLLPAF
jgi:phosphatidate cytidylyltransferase